LVNNLTCPVQIKVVRLKCNEDQCTREKKYLEEMEKLVKRATSNASI